MNLIRSLFVALFFFGMILGVSAQSKSPAFEISNLSSVIGKWYGSLTYLDYGTGKPYTMPSNITISYTSNKAGLIIDYDYPDEPKANSKDTTYSKTDGKYFGKEKVSQFHKTKFGDFILITEIEGIDGNDNKEAILKHTYRLAGSAFSIRKDVRFKGDTTWIKRHEYDFTKEHKVVSTDKLLFQKVAALDSMMFHAYNTQNLTKMKSYFTTDLEWYQDNGGLLSSETVFSNFQTMFDKKDKLSRELVKGSLEVIPLKDFGAIEIGKHRFKHMENGKLEIGTFRFVMIWKNVNGDWKISRVISFDH